MAAPEHTPTEEELFKAAAALPAEERAAYLESACRGDSDLRSGVERMLASLEDSGFMERAADRTTTMEMSGEFVRFKPEESGDIIGSYKLLQRIGEGGFVVVWMAEQEKPVRRRVALKIIKLGMDTKEVIARFEQERQALAIMDHPNIARVFDAGATPFGRPYFVMELVRGVKITEYCDQANLSTSDRLKLFIQVCHAVQHAHQKGIIHRDLKPSNILVTMHDGVAVPKVIDFGVAKATQQQRLTDLTLFTQFEQMIGTPLYMSPEQAEMSGLDIDTRSDIYSLGVLLYELLTGRTPFDPKELLQKGLDEVRRVIREQEPQKPSTLISTMGLDARTAVAGRRQTDGAKLIGLIRGDLDWIVMKALEKDRNRRYETANSLARDLDRHLASEPVQARPPSKAYRIQRFARRNKIACAAGVAVSVTLIAGATVSQWQAVRAHRSEGHALEASARATREAERANNALHELRASAPAFVAQARALIAKEEFTQALDKLNVAIKLHPQNLEYLLFRADILQAQLRFPEALAAYRAALQIDPASQRAIANTALCERLAAETPVPARDSLQDLLYSMQEEKRSAAEMIPVSRKLGLENNVLVNYWMERLKALPIGPEKPLKERLTINNVAELELDLSDTAVSDLRPLEDINLHSLNLARTSVTDLTPLAKQNSLRALDLASCKVTDLSPLRGIPIAYLKLNDTKISNVEPLAGMPLKSLSLNGTFVADITALQDLPLQELSLQGTKVTDLSALRNLKLTALNLGDTRVTDLSPLVAMPLMNLYCPQVAADDYSPLSGLPLEYLTLRGTRVEELSFLRKMPLKHLDLRMCFGARGFQVLNEISTLESAWLPENFVNLLEQDIEAIGKLRNHPTLRDIKVDARAMSLPTGADRTAFWSVFDSVMRPIRAMHRAKAGDFAEAERLLREQVDDINRTLIERGVPQSDWVCSNDWIMLATVILAQRDNAAYRRYCREVFETFGSSKTPFTAGRVFKICLLSRDPGIPMSVLEPLKKIADSLTLEPGPALHGGYYGQGLWEFRNGRWKEAIWLLENLDNFTVAGKLTKEVGGGLPITTATSHMRTAVGPLIAIAYWQLGDETTAMKELIRSERLGQAFWPEVQFSQWQNILLTQIFVEEAKQLIENSKSSRKTKSNR